MFRKFTYLLTLATAVYVACASTSHAQQSRFSISANFGQTLASEELSSQAVVSSDGLEEEAVFGLTLGYQLNQAIELELEFSRGGVSFTNTVGLVSGNDIELEISTFAGYATFRSSRDLYFVGRLGFIRETLLNTFDEQTQSDTGTSLGFGGGYRFTPWFSIEGEYTLVEADISWLFASARFAF